jgi:hypothetical protein
MLAACDRSHLTCGGKMTAREVSSGTSFFPADYRPLNCSRFIYRLIDAVSRNGTLLRNIEKNKQTETRQVTRDNTCGRK